ncbi:MAG: hypothetical protein HYZ74_09150 [Elusimicrobia bacterium]|nr:hypothetical protein [Elusimicrobiota bacterium]
MKKLLLVALGVSLSYPVRAQKILEDLGAAQAELIQKAQETAPPPAPAPAPAPKVEKASKTELWMGSIEYAALRVQNDWKGWDTSYVAAPGMPRDIAWVKSDEYKEQCAKTYALAWTAVSAAAKSQESDFAVVLDLDETAMDNIGYQLERNGQPFTPETWHAWVLRREATATPSAKEFIDKVRGLGPRAHLVFITDRNSAQQEATAENAEKIGIYKTGDLLLTKKDKTDTKDVRRKCATLGSTGEDERCRAHKPVTIIAQVGDSIRDFYEIYSRAEADEKVKSIAEDKRWGSFFFILPNPMYGQWERAYK